VIEFHHVTKSYDIGRELRILHDVNMVIERGELTAILGPSGSGKSTLLHIMGLLDRATGGQVLFEGRDVATLSDDELSTLRGRSIGFVFQSYQLIGYLSALENVEVPLFYRGVPPRERRERARRCLEAVRMLHRADHIPAKLSGGECQRVAIARALVGDPDLILADEPTGNLDTATGEEIVNIFQRLHAEGRTIALITHDTSLAARTPRVIHIRDGRVEPEEGAA
jgi:putative ABC transport system ATP-binding protein